MCHIISGVIPKNIKRESIQDILDEFSMNFSPLNNQHIEKQISDQMSYVLATRGSCDCGTMLGISSCNQIPASEHLPLEIKKMQKKGWSDAKIKRWKKDKLKAEENRTARTQAGIESKFKHLHGSNELTHWILFLKKMLSQGECTFVGLLLHWYSGDISTENFPLKIIETPINRLDENFLLKIEEDVLYVFS